jgi:plastocyanin
MHFNGTIWSVVPSPSPGQNSSLSSVVALADGTVWAAGFYYDGTQTRTLLLHGDSSGFAAVAGEDYPNEGNVLNGIAVSSSGDIWAAGYHYPSGTSDYQGLIEHYDGQQWTRVSSAQGTSYTYLAGITAQAGGASWAVGNTLTTTIVEAVCEIQVGDTGFVPPSASENQGDTVGWSITGSSAHQLVDASGTQLFDSGSRESGASFQFTFNAAASYSIVDLATNASSVVAVPVKLPLIGTTGMPFTVTWSAAAPSESFVFDVQVRTPSDTAFHNWQVGQSDVAATYVPSSAGSYAFRARLRNSTNGAFAKWSPARTVSVANP